MAQMFKGDATEQKYLACGTTIIDQLSTQKTNFFDDAYACFVLGELLYDNDRSPLANSISRDIFRESFSTIFDSFLLAGSFESYITVFQNIFGADVEITFTVPAPGKLNIDIVATDITLYNIAVRSIAGDSYVIDEIIDDEDDFIVLQAIKGFDSQYELEQMLYEMVPAGIFTEISLTVGGA